MSTTTPPPTPETDAALVDHMPKDATEWSEHYLTLCIHSRKLERERDSAKSLNKTLLDQLEAQATLLEAVRHERDNTWEKLEAMREAIKEAYEALDNCIEFINDAQIIEAQWHWEPVKQSKAALAKLKPLLP